MSGTTGQACRLASVERLQFHNINSRARAFVRRRNLFGVWAMAHVREFSLAESNLTVVEAAAHLRMSRSSLYALIARGAIRVIKRGRRSVVSGEEIARFQAEERRAVAS